MLPRSSRRIAPDIARLVPGPVGDRIRRLGERILRENTRALPSESMFVKYSLCTGEGTVPMRNAYTGLRAAIQRESLVGKQSRAGRASGSNRAWRSDSVSVRAVK